MGLEPVSCIGNPLQKVIHGLFQHHAIQQATSSGHDPCERCELKEARANPRNNRLVSWVSKYFFITNEECLRAIKIRKDFRGCTNFVVLGKQNRIPTAIYVYVEMAVEPCKSCRLANQVKKGNFIVSTPSSRAIAAFDEDPHIDDNRKAMLEAFSWRMVKKGLCIVPL